MVKLCVKYSILAVMAVLAAPMVASAGTPITVQTVPWIASGASPYHYSWDGNPITLKGVTNVQDTGTNTILYDWNPGDGTAHCTGVVTNMYNVSCAHTYTYANGATIGNTFGATLTVYDCSSGTGAASPCNTAPYSNTASAVYQTTIYLGPTATAGNPVAAAPNLPVEVNNAIDAGLWNLHTTATHTVAYPGSGASFNGSADTNPADAAYGFITNFSLAAGGSGYVSPVTITAVDNYCYPYKQAGYYPQACGSGFLATATINGSGTITSVTVVNPGANYALDYGGYYYQSVSFTVAGGGSTQVVDWGGLNPAGITATDCQAFEVSGHLASGPTSDPYTADVTGCLAAIFSVLQTTSVTGTKTNTHGSFTTDQNSNGIGVHLVDGAQEDQYQGGMIVDAITASKTPNQVVTVGPLALLGHPPSGAVGTYTYGDAVNDMVDYITYCQSANGSVSAQGSWDYGCQESEDNSIAQWNAIGLLAAVRDFSSTVPADTLLANQDWITASQEAGFNGNGYFGYRSNSPLWGPYAVTPSGMVQMALNGIGRSTTATCCLTTASPGTASQFDYAESFIRDNFDTAQSGNPTTTLKDYYYGMYSTTKSMILHDNTQQGGGKSPIQFMRSLDNASEPLIDWYAAQTAAYGGTDTSNGIARTLISGTPANSVTGQNSDGSWSGHDYTSAQYPFETAWAIIMLNHTVTNPPPSACATSPSGTNDTSIQLNGSCSTDTNPGVTVTNWQWDVSCTGGTNYTVTGVKPFYTFNVNPNLLPYSCPVTLKVTASDGQTNTTIIQVSLSAAAGDAAPVASAGGPYSFCPNLTPWTLDADLSYNPGVDTITGYGWNFTSNCAGTTYTDSTLQQPRVDTGTPNMFSYQPGNYCVKVQVTNNKGYTNVATSTVTINSATSTNCTNCVSQPTAKTTNITPGKSGTVQVYWFNTNSTALPVDHYDVLRSTDGFVTQTEIAGPNGVFPSIAAGPANSTEQLSFIDTSVTAAGTYSYRVIPATAGDNSLCASPLTITVTVKSGRG